MRGLFVYAWKIYHGPYERLAAPEVAVTIDALPAELGSVARLGLLDVEFAHDDEIRFPYVDAHPAHGRRGVVPGGRRPCRWRCSPEWLSGFEGGRARGGGGSSVSDDAPVRRRPTCSGT
jgi:hypothetical protein